MFDQRTRVNVWKTVSFDSIRSFKKWFHCWESLTGVSIKALTLRVVFPCNFNLSLRSLGVTIDRNRFTKTLLRRQDQPAVTDLSINLYVVQQHSQQQQPRRRRRCVIDWPLVLITITRRKRAKQAVILSRWLQKRKHRRQNSANFACFSTLKNTESGRGPSRRPPVAPSSGFNLT